jgi:DNA-binding transcriptional regulator LsrR (DeoR family)
VVGTLTAGHAVSMIPDADRPSGLCSPWGSSFVSRFALLVKASRLYYELGDTQQEVARALGLTRSHVSRLLKEAREEGIVEIRIHDGSSRHEELAARLRDRFGLHQVRLAPWIAESAESSLRVLGRAGASVLREHLRDGYVIGVGRGRTLAAVAAQLPGGTPLPMASLVALTGGTDAVGGGIPARQVGQALGARVVELYAPGVLPDPQVRDALLASRELSDVRHAWSSLDVAIMGIGAFGPPGGWIDLRFVKELEAEHAVGELLLHHFDLEGRFIGDDLRARVIAMDVRDLARVPVRILVAGGPGKVEPLLGALRTRLLSVLVTDDETAAAVLGLDEATSGASPG